MRPVAFEKYQGLGNDFVVVCQDPEDFPHDQAQRMCDRHFGVGADGVLFISPAGSTNARARMTVLNADGSRPEMCGNGLRCVALHLARASGPLHQAFVVETDAGPRRCVVELAADDPRSAQVSTDMGRGQLGGSLDVLFAEQPYRFTQVTMGNPHAVRFGPPESLARVDELGPLVSATVAGGLNVEFATLQEDAIEVVVWERGVGRTLACGTGAAATAVAAAAQGLVPFDSQVTVRLPGGPLAIFVAKENLGVELRGPAKWVFSGEWSA